MDECATVNAIRHEFECTREATSHDRDIGFGCQGSRNFNGNGESDQGKYRMDFAKSSEADVCRAVIDRFFSKCTMAAVKARK